MTELEEVYFETWVRIRLQEKMLKRARKELEQLWFGYKGKDKPKGIVSSLVDKK